MLFLVRNRKYFTAEPMRPAIGRSIQAACPCSLIHIMLINNRKRVMLIRTPGDTIRPVFYKIRLPKTEKIIRPVFMVVGSPDIPFIGKAVTQRAMINIRI